mgnify:CR=1 FL=1
MKYEDFYIFEGVEPTYQEATEKAIAHWNERYGKYSKNPEKDLKFYLEDMTESFRLSIRRAMGKPAPTTEYVEEIPDYGDLMTVENFKESVKYGALIDYDGHGLVVKDRKMAKWVMYPSIAHLIPEDATHVMWFNK